MKSKFKVRYLDNFYSEDVYVNEVEGIKESSNHVADKNMNSRRIKKYRFPIILCIVINTLNVPLTLPLLRQYSYYGWLGIALMWSAALVLVNLACL